MPPHAEMFLTPFGTDSSDARRTRFVMTPPRTATMYPSRRRRRRRVVFEQRRFTFSQTRSSRESCNSSFLFFFFPFFFSSLFFLLLTMKTNVNMTHGLNSSPDRFYVLLACVVNQNRIYICIYMQKHTPHTYITRYHTCTTRSFRKTICHDFFFFEQTKRKPKDGKTTAN